MKPESWPKYQIGDEDFAIQPLKRSGYNKMLRPHAHTSYELYYLLSGERVYFMNGSVYVVQKGDMVFVNPGDLHSTASSEVLEFERVLIHFSPSFMDGASDWMDSFVPSKQSGLIRLTMKEQAHAERLIHQMLTECVDRQLNYETCVRAHLLELLVCLRRAEQLHHAPQAHSHPMHHKISEIAAYIHLHYQEPITLDSIAKRFYISPSYLSRIFVKLTGFHFREYIQVTRIREAEQRLRSTKDKVQAISEQVGFEHIAHFNRIFKKMTGLSPLRYRKHQ